MDTNLTTQPLVSIMMATYNRASFIREAIDSALTQSYTNWELIVLDDASTDDTATIVRNYAAHDARIIYAPAERNLGIAKNRNRGFALMHSDLVAVLDSDDLWHDPKKLAKQVAYLADSPACVLVGTNVRTIDEHGNALSTFMYETDDTLIRAHMLRRNQFTHSSVLFRAAPLRGAAAPYPEYLLIGEDYALFLELGTHGTLANLPDIMTSYRIHAGGITKQRALLGARSHLALLRAYSNRYPHAFSAYIKAYLRILKSFF